MANPMEIKGDNIWEKLGSLHWFPIGAIILLLIFIPLLNPLGLPISTNTWTIDAYDAILAVPDDKVVIWEDNWSIGGLADSEPGHIALMRIMLENNIKFVMVSLTPDTPLLHTYITDAVNDYPESQGKVYGVDWVQMGFLAGQEGALSLMAEDMHSAFSSDYYGTPLSQLPLMDNVIDFNDVALVISGSSSQTWVEAPVRQWYTKYDVDVVSYTLSGGTVLSATYWPNNGIVGIIEGSRGGAELEFIGSVPGVGAAQSDAKTLAFLATAGFIVLGNISYFGAKWAKEDEE
jgi:hypothetical protein